MRFIWLNNKNNKLLIKKKKKIIIGLLCGFGVLALTVGITTPLLMCHPTQKILVTFASSEQGVTITPNSVEVAAGTTFGSVKSQVLASKVTGNTQWLFQYWYKSDDKTKTKVSDDFVINESLTVSPFFEELSEDDLIVNFTPAEGDTNVEISTQSKTIKKGTTFIQIYDDVTAKKIVDGVEWEFRWWYKDGDEPTRKMSNDAIIDENITVHPYFVAPPVKEKVTLNFVEGTQETGEVTIHSSGGCHFVVDKYTTFGSIVEKYEITAERSDGAVFKYWAVDPFEPIPGKDWIKPVEVENSLPITNEVLNVFPYFEKQDTEWVDKTIKWEEQQIGAEQYQSYSQEIVINKAPQVNTYTYDLSHFIVCDPNATHGIIDIDNPIGLDQDDIVSVEVINVTEGYQDLFKEVVVVQDETSQTLNKLNVRFTFDILSITIPIEPINFSLRFKITNKILGKEAESTISGFTLQIKDPEPTIEPIKVEYHKPANLNQNEIAETFETADGFKSVSINSKERSTQRLGYFTLSRDVKSDEKLEIIIEGDNADNLQTTNFHIVTENNIPYVNFDIGFKKIDYIGYEHTAEFNLKFIVTTDSIGEQAISEIEDTFVLKFNPDRQYHPYAIVLDNAYTAKLGETEISFDVNIENIEEGAKPSYFKEGDFLTVENITRKGEGGNPVWFSAPCEQDNPMYPISEGVGTPIIPIEGDNTRDKTLRMNFCFSDDAPAPDKRTEYTTHLVFHFWKGNPLESKQEINYVEKDVTFIYDPDIPLVFSNDIWAQTHSVGIVQKATNKNTQKVEEKFGTGWILSRQPGSGIYYLATAYDVKREYLEFETNNYENHTIGITFANSNKKYIPGDDQSYIILDDGSEFVDDSENDNNDVIEFYIHDETGTNGWEWVDDDLYWANSFLWSTTYIGPDVAVATINMGSHQMTNSNEILFNRYWTPFVNTLDKWATNDGLDTDHGQLIGLYDPTDNKSFDKTKYSYGYVGGFDSKEITLPSGIKTNAFYWKSFDRPLGNGQIDLIGTTTYYLFCSGDGQRLGQTPGSDNIIHRCPAFTLMTSAFNEDEYFGPAGRGAMFLLRPNDPDHARTLLPPIAAAMNWNGYSLLNLDGHITPYFDCFAYDSQRTDRNLLAPYIKH